MEFFDTFYRPDTTSQRYRLVGATVPVLLAGVLPWIMPLRLYLADFRLARVLADVVATGLHLATFPPPYPSPAVPSTAAADSAGLGRWGQGSKPADNGAARIRPADTHLAHGPMAAGHYLPANGAPVLCVAVS